MVGGRIIETIPMFLDGRGNVVRLWCVDTRNPMDECAVYTKDAPLDKLPKVGDSIWWQGGTIYWTDKNRTFNDKPLPKIGNSFNPTKRMA